MVPESGIMVLWTSQKLKFWGKRLSSGSGNGRDGIQAPESGAELPLSSSEEDQVPAGVEEVTLGNV